MKQPEALRLADALDSDLSAEWMQGITLKHISNELRRLHEVNAELVEALKAALSDDQPYIEKCKAALAKATGENNE
jgi:hypothetical protein